jgi:hypothetical protein
MLFCPLLGRFRNEIRKEWYASPQWPLREITLYEFFARRGRAGCTSPMASFGTEPRGQRWRVRVEYRPRDEHRTRD